MAHVLLAGRSALLDEVAGWLRGWGMTVDARSTASLPAALAEDRRYDMMVVACGPDADRNLCRVMESLDGRDAPILLIGGPARRCHCRQVCRRSLDLEAALRQRPGLAAEDCLGSTSWSHPEPAQLTGIHDYIQFLNHELRTPLTAAQTALQALARAPGASWEGPWAELVGIALRNLERLRQAVTWSEDYLSTRTAGQPARWCSTTVRDMVAQLEPDDFPAPEFTVDCREELAARKLVAAIELVPIAGRQILRALWCHAPTAAVTLRVRLQEASATGPPLDGQVGVPGELVFAYHLLASSPADSPGTVIRTGLISSQEQSADELARLMEFTVSREVLLQMHARVTIGRGTGARDPAAELVLPLLVTAPALEAQDPCDLWVRA